jgi:hypothetical protein
MHNMQIAPIYDLILLGYVFHGSLLRFLSMFFLAERVDK